MNLAANSHSTRLLVIIPSITFSVFLVNALNQIWYVCWLVAHVLLETDLETTESLIDLSSIEPSWWVWVDDETVPSNVEEGSIIDNENYVVVSEESVVDGVANFIAKSVLSNPSAQVCMWPKQVVFPSLYNIIPMLHTVWFFMYYRNRLLKSFRRVSSQLFINLFSFWTVHVIYTSSCPAFVSLYFFFSRLIHQLIFDSIRCVNMTFKFEITALTKALCDNGMSKVETMLDIWHAGAMFYTLSAWGLALIGWVTTKFSESCTIVGTVIKDNP